jgi:hypothetical protein
MAVMRSKWKALLVLNYISAIIWLLMLLVFVFMIWQAKQGGNEIKTNVIAISTGGGVIILFNIFYIYVLKAYFPSRILTGIVKLLYITGLVVMSFVALLFLGLLLFSAYDIFSNIGGAIDSYSLVTLIFIFFFTIISSLLVFWHFQLIDVLNRNSEEKVKSVLDSIGVDENNSIV